MLQITRINQKGQKVETLIKVEEINGVAEKTKEDTKLYNENGEVVQTTPNESVFKVYLTSGEIYIEKSEYEKLKKYLKVETL